MNMDTVETTTPTTEPTKPSVRSWAVPSLDVLHQDGTYKVLVDLPGVAPGDVTLAREDGGLLLSATRKDRPDRGYQRRLAVPDHLDADDVDAVLADGVLTLILRPRPVATRTIPVRAG